MAREKDNLNSVAAAERIHIGFFGMINSGKSSIVNAVTNQDLSIVSKVKGTTTDPVKKNMELLPLGPVTIVDTPGLDDTDELGKLRVKKALKELESIDIAVLVIDAKKGASKQDKELLARIKKAKTRHIVVFNKSDLLDIKELDGIDRLVKSVDAENVITASAKTGANVSKLKEMLGSLKDGASEQRKLVSDLLSKDDLVILVAPIDSSAPKGRLILPQQQTIRDVLDSHCICMVSQVEELESCISVLSKKPRLVITDSQAFDRVSKIVPKDIPLTSFSILFARYKGDLECVVEGAYELDGLEDGDKVLISEGCTHHRQCDDIGTVKLPSWISKYTGKKIAFSFTQGGTYPENLESYKLIVHCGACMLTTKQMQARIEATKNAHIPITNYGIAIAHMNGILKRSVEPFGL